MKANTYLPTFLEHLQEFKVATERNLDTRFELHSNILFAAQLLKEHHQIGEEHRDVIAHLLAYPQLIPTRLGGFRSLTMKSLLTQPSPTTRV